jgi:hypothetical protein
MTTATNGGGSATRASLLNPPRAKVHPLRAQIGQELRGCQSQEDFVVCGRTYTLRTLWPVEEEWADSLVDGSTIYQAGRNRRAPYVAAALVAVDGVPVQELFQLPDDTPDELRNLYLSAPDALVSWRRSEVFRWLKEEVQPPVLAELWGSYQVLEERRREALEKIGPLSTRTAPPPSSPTSSPEKAS